MNDEPSAFSKHNPNLQTVWDSTSMKALQTCPRFYQLTILDGWVGSTVDLEFGIFFASAVETFKKERLNGKSREEAQRSAIEYVVKATWDDVAWRGPWGGSYEELWHCTGTTKYKNAKGNAAKCPWSHKGKWFPAPAPHTCGECGSDTESVRRWVPHNADKHRVSLVRLVWGYTEEQPDDGDMWGFHPFKFPNGQPAVELSVKMPLPFKNKYGEPYVLSAHLDSIMQTADGEEKFISDNKSTKKTLGKGFWAGYEPNTQMEVYDLMGSTLFADLDLKGVLIEGAQVLRGGGKFAAQPLHRTEQQREETFNNIENWLRLAEQYAEANHWPMATSNCWTCPFKGVCSKSPEKRSMYLNADFKRRKWNPAAER